MHFLQLFMGDRYVLSMDEDQQSARLCVWDLRAACGLQTIQVNRHSQFVLHADRLLISCAFSDTSLWVSFGLGQIFNDVLLSKIRQRILRLIFIIYTPGILI